MTLPPTSAPDPVAPIGQGAPDYIWNFIFYRGVSGIGIGLASMLSPMYIAEIAPATLRGSLIPETKGRTLEELEELWNR